MLEQYEKFLNCNEYLRSKINKFIDAFASYYGEENRSEIEEKFSKAIFIAYTRPDFKKNILSEIVKYISNDIVSKKIDEISTIFEVSDFINDDSFDNYKVLPIYYFNEFYNKYLMGEEERIKKYKINSLNYIQKYVPNFTVDDLEETITTKSISSKYESLPLWLKNKILYYCDLSNAKKEYEYLFARVKPILAKIDSNVSLDNINNLVKDERFIQYYNIASKFNEMLEEYKERMGKYSAYIDEANKIKKLKGKLNNEYYLKFIKENIDLLSEQDIEKLKIFEEDLDKRYELTSNTNFIFGYNLDVCHVLESFSEEADLIIGEDSWKKDSIINDRINYFKHYGIDLGDDYQKYLESEEAKAMWPSKERVKKFIESKNRLKNEFNNEFFNLIESNSKVRNEIELHGLLDKEDSFNAKLYNGGIDITCVNPNIVLNQNGYDLFSLVLISCNSMDGNIDHDICHELNHLYELYLKQVEGEKYEALCGWDIIKGKIYQANVKQINTLEKEDNNRSYELFNEIINELIAQEIYSKMLEKNEHVFDTSENAKVKDLTSYEHTFFLVKDFFQEFKNEILSSRKNGRMDIIWNKVGKDNFDELNSLFHIFFEHFSGFKIYDLYGAINEKKDTEETRIYYDLITRRDKILENMRQYSNSQNMDEIVNKSM